MNTAEHFVVQVSMSAVGAWTNIGAEYADCAAAQYFAQSVTNILKRKTRVIRVQQVTMAVTHTNEVA